MNFKQAEVFESEQDMLSFVQWYETHPILAKSNWDNTRYEIAKTEWKHKVCVVWCEIPEYTNFVLLDLNDKEYELVKTFNDHFINSTNIPQKTKMDMLKFFYDEEGAFKFNKTKGPLEFWSFELILMCGMFM